jgi:hypothetical protein
LLPGFVVNSPNASPYRTRHPLLFAIWFFPDLQNEGQNRSRSHAAKQECKKWTLSKRPFLARGVS